MQSITRIMPSVSRIMPLTNRISRIIFCLFLICCPPHVYSRPLFATSHFINTYPTETAHVRVSTRPATWSASVRKSQRLSRRPIMFCLGIIWFFDYLIPCPQASPREERRRRSKNFENANAQAPRYTTHAHAVTATEHIKQITTSGALCAMQPKRSGPTTNAHNT